MKGLLIRSLWIEKILKGEKTWEIRGSNTKIRGRIALIRSGSGLVVGTCEIVDSLGPLTLLDIQKNASKCGVKRSEIPKELPYKKTYAWVLENAKPLTEPVPSEHPHGTVIQANLEQRVVKRILASEP